MDFWHLQRLGKLDVTKLDPAPPTSYRPALPDWGVYLHWPSHNDDWIHAADVEVVHQLIPGPRVFKRTKWDGQYYHLSYGEISFRVRPSLWLRVPEIDLEVGQQVELLSLHGRNDPGIYRIADIFFAPKQGAIEYALQGVSLELERRFDRSDLRPVHVAYTLRPSDFFHRTTDSDEQ